MTSHDPVPEIPVTTEPGVCTAAGFTASGVEAGFKADLLDNTARITGTVFKYRVKDMQLTAGSGSINQNCCGFLIQMAQHVTLINPVVTWRSEEKFDVWDECVSIPDVVVRVQRHRSISLTYRDERGREREWLNLPPDLAELLQHEIDHLDGVLFVDHISKLKRDMVFKKFRKLARQRGDGPVMA